MNKVGISSRNKRRYRGKSTWHEPEYLGPTQFLRDQDFPNRKYFVYVLETDYGHYVGHTARFDARMREHERGDTWSTRDGNPREVWRSGPFDMRDQATKFEAALKSLRDQKAKRFQEIVGVSPRPFRRVSVTNYKTYPTPQRNWAPIALVASIAAIIGVGFLLQAL